MQSESYWQVQYLYRRDEFGTEDWRPVMLNRRPNRWSGRMGSPSYRKAEHLLTEEAKYRKLEVRLVLICETPVRQMQTAWQFGAPSKKRSKRR